MILSGHEWKVVVEIFCQIVFLVEIDPEFALAGLRVVLDWMAA